MKSVIKNLFHQTLFSSILIGVLVLSFFANLISVSAKYLNQESNQGNSFQAGILDGEFIDYELISESEIGSTHKFFIQNQGNLDLAYALNIMSDNQACLNLKMDLSIDSLLLFSGSIGDFSLVNDSLASGQNNEIQADFDYNGVSFTECGLEFDLLAKQVGRINLPVGYSDIETLPLVLNSGREETDAETKVSGLEFETEDELWEKVVEKAEVARQAAGAESGFEDPIESGTEDGQGEMRDGEKQVEENKEEKSEEDIEEPAPESENSKTETGEKKEESSKEEEKNENEKGELVIEPEIESAEEKPVEEGIKEDPQPSTEESFSSIEEETEAGHNNSKEDNNSEENDAE